MNRSTDKSYIIKIDSVKLLFERSKRAKRVIIYVNPAAGVRVAVPKNVSFKKAEEFAAGKIRWIKRQLQKIEIKKKQQCEYNCRDDNCNEKELKEKLKKRLKFLAEKYEFQFNRVFIRSQKTLWGSCSAKNNVNLNVKLAMLPDELRDYVIMHELVHTRIKNHSKEFWDELEKYVKDPKSIDKKLKNYIPALL